jgi:predicted SAM-dependent methyltransferase
MKLMLCAGATRRQGWMTLDVGAPFRADYQIKIPPLPESVKQIEWEEIELIHGITSFYPWEAKFLLQEIYAVLAPNGKLVLEQPDLHYVTDAIASGAGSVEWLFGDPQFQNPWHMNKWAYSPQTLTALLESVGFKHVARLQAQHHNPIRDFRMEAWK